MIKISVVIPVYNTEKYINKCLDSIVSQSLKEIEIIIVNDGSYDNSNLLIEQYKKLDERIVVINKKNGGLSSARNAGIKRARGKYIINIDSDDWIEQDYFKDLYIKAEENDLDIVISDFYYDYGNGIVKYTSDGFISENEIVGSKNYIELFLKGNIFPAVWNKMYKTKLYLENQIFHPEGISLGEDLGTTPLLAQKAKRIGKINKAYLHYMQNLDSLTKSNPTKRIYELIFVFKLLEKKIEKFKKSDMNLKKIQSIGLLIFNSTYDLKDNFYNDALEYYVSLFKEDYTYKKLPLKIKIYYSILKSFPNIKVLKNLCYFERMVKKIKTKVKL